MPENAAFDDALLAEVTETLMECDGYVVLAVDPLTGEVDADGPYDGLASSVRADQLRRDLDSDGLDDVAVGVVRLHNPT